MFEVWYLLYIVGTDTNKFNEKRIAFRKLIIYILYCKINCRLTFERPG